MKRFLIPALAAFATVLVSNAFAQMPPPPPMVRMISVTGEAHQDFSPDQAVMNLSLVSRNANLAEAKQHNDALAKKLMAITTEFNIPAEKVATSGLYISPEYNYDNSKQRLIGYIVNRSLRITMDKMDIHERLLSKIVDAGVDQVSGVEFRLADPEAAAQKIRAKAFENAKARAQTLATAAGVTLGKPISISTSGAAPIMPPMPMMARAMDAAGAESSSVAPSLPGMISIQENVSVVFSLE